VIVKPDELQLCWQRAPRDGASSTGAAVVLDHSVLLGAPDSGMISMTGDKSSVALTGGSKLDYPLSISVGISGAGGGVELEDSTLRSVSSSSNGVLVVAAVGRFERVGAETSAQQAPLLAAKSSPTRLTNPFFAKIEEAHD